MSQEKGATTSPFSAMSYQEQQDRWLEWRSRQLDYQPAQKEQVAENTFPEPEEPLQPVQLPYFRQAAPTRHRELDRVLSRHSQAARHAGNFQTTSIGGSGR